MIGIDCFGFDVRVNQQQQLRFTFAEAISNAQQARAALVAMAKTCRT
jgi:putative heme iron utilization protein